MITGWMTGIPILVLIVFVLKTKRITEGMLLSSFVATLFVFGCDFVEGYVELLFETLSNESFQLLVIVSICFSGMIGILEKSGAMLGLQTEIKRICKGQKSTLILTWLLGGLIFIDDYLNALAVSASMKGLSDAYSIPREHLAFSVNCMGACVCVMIPVSSWSVFAMGCLSSYGLSYVDYYKAIPYMLYPICTVSICFLLAIGKFPKLGLLKGAYDSVKKRPLQEVEEGRESSASFWVFLLPMGALILVTSLCNNNIVIGILASLFVLLILLKGARLMTIQKSLEEFCIGASSITPLLINISLGFILQAANERMGFTNYIIQLCASNTIAWMLPAMVFVMVGLIAFLAASFWMLIVICFPIFIPLAMEIGVPVELIIAATMSGVALGSQACLYSDAMFMVSTATGVPNDIQFKVAIPYVVIGGIISTVLYLILGKLMMG